MRNESSNWFSRRARFLKVCTIRFFRKAKPTEWITAFTGVLTVLSAIGAAVYLVNNGYFEAKKSEYEAKKSELQIQIVKAEIDRDRLATTKGYLETRISEANIALKEKEDELAKSKKEIARSAAEVSVYKAELAEHDKWDSIRYTIQKYKGGKNGLKLTTFYTDNSDNPRSIFGFDITGTSYNRDDVTESLAEMLNTMEHIPRLSMISIQDVDISKKLFQINLMYLGKVSSAYFVNCGLTDKNIESLQFRNSTLNVLSLANNNISIMPKIESAVHIKAIDVSRTRITDEIMMPIILKAKGLQHLNFRDCPISDKTIAVITNEYDSLTRIVLLGTSITIDGCTKLYKRHPANIVCSKDHVDLVKLKEDCSKFEPGRSVIVLLKDTTAQNYIVTGNSRRFYNGGEEEFTYSREEQWIKIAW